MKAVGLGNAVEHFNALQVTRREGMVTDVIDALVPFGIKVTRVRLHHVGAENNVGEEGARQPCKNNKIKAIIHIKYAR